MDLDYNLLPHLDQLNSEQITNLYNQLFYITPPHNTVSSIIKQYCPNGIVPSQQIPDVLKSLHQQLELEDKAYWDFQALINSNNGTITMSSALLLFRDLHGEKFSTNYWNQFTKSRKGSYCDVSWLEIQPWICNIPESGHQLEEFEKVQKNVQEFTERENMETSLQLHKQARNSSVRESFIESERMKFRTKQSLYRWEMGGLSEFLFSDVTHDSTRIHNEVNINDVLTYIDEKYNELRYKILYSMIVQFSGETTWNILTENDKQETLDDIITDERCLRSSGKLKTEIHNLPGAELFGQSSFGSLKAKMDDIEVSRGKFDFRSLPSIKQFWSQLQDKRCNYGEHLIDLYERQERERSLFIQLSRSNKQKKLKQELAAYYLQLHRQLEIIKSESDFNTSSLKVGLAERSSTKQYYSIDRTRQENVAFNHIKNPHKPKHRFTTENMSEADLHARGKVDIMKNAVKAVSLKHVAELNIAVRLLRQRSKSDEKQSDLRKDNLIQQLTALSKQRSYWRDSSDDGKPLGTENHIKILQSALSLFYNTESASCQEEFGVSGEAHVDGSILSKLLVKQGEEFDQIIDKLSNKPKSEVISILKMEEASTRCEYCDNIAALLFSGVVCSEEDKAYVTALDVKFEALSNQLILFSLAKKYGESWHSRSAEDKARHVRELKKQLDEQREKGNIIEMDLLLGNTAADLSVWQLMGENRLDFERKLNSPHETNDSEPPREVGVVHSLHQRYYSEYAAVLDFVHRTPNVQPQVLLSRIRMETHTIKHAVDFRIAAYNCGLLERLEALPDHRIEGDFVRLENLAACLVSKQQFNNRIGFKQPKSITQPTPLRGEITETVTSLLKELSSRHSDERTSLLDIMLDTGLQELQEVADLMTPEKQRKRLVELQLKQRLLIGSNETRDELMDILEESAAIQLCLLPDIMLEQQKSADQFNLVKFLTVELIKIQEKETAFIVASLNDMRKGKKPTNEEELRKQFNDEIEARRFSINKNVAKVLTSYFGEFDDDFINNLIREKYQAYERAVFLTTLRKQHKDFDNKSISDREKLISELKERMIAAKLNNERDSVVETFNKSVFEDEHVFFEIFGENLFEFSRRVNAIVQSKQNDGREIYSVDESEVKYSDCQAAFSQYHDEEKQAYRNLLNGVYGIYLGEQGRIAEVIRLQLQTTLINMSHDLHNAARYLSITDRCQIVSYLTKSTAHYNLMPNGDWRRFLDLAEMIIESNGASLPIANLTVNVTELGENCQLYSILAGMMKRLLERQRDDFKQLLNIINGLTQHDKSSASQILYEGKIQKLQILHKQTDEPDSVLLSEACSLKLSLWSEFDVEEPAAVYLTAELLERQAHQLSDFISLFSNKTMDEIEEICEKFLQDNSVLFTALCNIMHLVKDAQTQIKDAIELKYDTLKDQLVMEALINQLGESEWQRLSEEEKQRKLLELKMKEAKLRKEGRYDEAAALVSQFLKDSENLNQLITDEKSEYDRLMKERIGRKHLRIVQGMSEEEAELLEQEEAKSDEKLMADKRKNILLTLDNKCEQELAGILSNLNQHQTKTDRNRQLQEELLRAHRNQIKIENEDNFTAAALLLNMAENQEQVPENSRQVQERLARERLTKRHIFRRKSTFDNRIPETNDILELRDIVYARLDYRQQQEREALIELQNTAGNNLPAADLEECEEKILELAEERQSVREHSFFKAELQQQLLTEGCGYKIKLRGLALTNEHTSDTLEDIKVSLLADLQEYQSKECQMMLTDLKNKTAQTLKQTIREILRSLMWQDNVSMTILNLEKSQSGEQDELMRALNSNYDALKDKLIMQGLMAQLSEAEWSALSEAERQQKLLKIKLEERRLRAQGREDEAVELLNGLVNAQQGMDNVRSDQEKLLKERAAKLKKRLSSNPADSEAAEQLRTVEEKLKRANVLDNLQFELDSEKDRILGMLKSQNDSLVADKMKQLELARIRRQQKLIKKEEKLDEVSALIHMHAKNEENRLAGLGIDKEMQLELARRRLALRKQKPLQQQMTEEEAADNVESQSASVPVMDRLLEVVSKKHKKELSFLIDQLNSIENDPEYLEQALHVSLVKIRTALEKLELSCRKINDKILHSSEVSERDKMELEKDLSRAVLYTLSGELISLKGESCTADSNDIQEKSALILSKLQTEQSNEESNVAQLALKEEETVLESLIEAYETTMQRHVYENIITALFSILDDENKWTDGSRLTTIEDKFKLEKCQIIKEIESGNDQVQKNGKTYDAQELLKIIEADHERQKQAFQNQMDKQFEMIRDRQRSKRQTRFADDCNTARSLLQMAEESHTRHKDAQAEDKGKQFDMMKERLAQRKVERARLAEAERLAEEQRPKSSKAAGIFETLMTIHNMSMKRERTVINMSDDHKQEQLSEIVKQKDLKERAMDEERSRQNAQMMAKLHAKRSKKLSAADDIIGRGQRQANTLERSRSLDRDRQNSILRDKFNKLLTEKTMTLKPRSKSMTFGSLLDAADDKEKSEKMKSVAANLQKKFVDESAAVQLGQLKSLKIGDHSDEEPAAPVKILSKDEKAKILKERRLARKKAKEQQAASSNTENTE